MVDRNRKADRHLHWVLRVGIEGALATRNSRNTLKEKGRQGGAIRMTSVGRADKNVPKLKLAH